MNMYKGFLFATASGATFAPLALAPAQAADLPMKAVAPMAVMPAPSWQGWYVGVNVGAAYQQGANYGSQINGTSFIGGGQVGVNWQRGNFVYGFEADISGLSGPGSSTAGYYTGGYSNQINWLATFRGRAGLAVNDTLVYATFGLAVGGVENKLPSYFSGYGNSSSTRVGWVVGGGVEHMWNQNWTVGLEALFVDLGSYTYSGKNGYFRNTVSNQAVIGRFKMNYKW